MCVYKFFILFIQYLIIIQCKHQLAIIFALKLKKGIVKHEISDEDYSKLILEHV